MNPMATTALHPCGHHEVLTIEADCDQPGKLYELPNGERAWVCDAHAFAIEDLLRPIR